jgi:hypothetical protein
MDLTFGWQLGFPSPLKRAFLAGDSAFHKSILLKWSPPRHLSQAKNAGFFTFD